MSLYALAAMAGIATLVVTLTNTSPELLASVLLFLPFPFAALMFSYLGHVNAMSNVSMFIAEYIEPSIQQVLDLDNGKALFQFTGWQEFHYKQLRGLTGWISYGGWALGQGLIIGLPIVGSMVAFFFTIEYANLPIAGWWTTVLTLDLILIVLLLLLITVTIYRYGFFGSRKMKTLNKRVRAKPEAG